MTGACWNHQKAHEPPSFFMRRLSAQIPDGTSRLRWTLNRRVPTLDHLILRRRGSTVLEKATIEFNIPAIAPKVLPVKKANT